MAHPRPPESLAPPTGEPFAVPRVRSAWRAFARVHGLQRPPPRGKHALPPGLAAALCAPVLAQQWMASQDPAFLSAAPPSMTVDEESVARVDLDVPLSVEAVQRAAGHWVTSCLQDGDVVARVTWTWSGG